MKLKNKNILIIGGTGFIGFNLAKNCLKRGLNVFSLSTSKPKRLKKLNKVKYIIGNIKNFNKLKNVLKNIEFDFIVNCGGNVNHKKNKDRELYDSHYRGCINLYNLFKEKNIQSFIQVGSSSEYGDSQVPHKENYLCKPKEAYGRYKLRSTNFLLSQYKKNKFPIVILRFYQVYGPYQDFNRFISQLFKASIKKEKFLTSTGEQRRDLLFIDDAIEAIIKVILSNKSNGEIINIGYGMAIKLKKVMEMVKEKNKYLDPDYSRIKLRADEQMSSYPNILKAKKILNWVPKTSIKKGIDLTNKYYKKLLKKK